jgi:hypothetical protein
MKRLHWRLVAGRKRLLTAVRLVRSKGLGRLTDDDVQSVGAHEDDVELKDEVGDSNADSDSRAGEGSVELKDVQDSDGAGALQSDGSAGEDHGVDDKGARDDADVGGGLPAANKLVPKWRQMELDQLAQNTEWKNDGTALSTRGPSRCSACGKASHKATTCTKRGTGLMLRRAGLLSGQANDRMRPEGWVVRKREQLVEHQPKMEAKRPRVGGSAAALEPGTTVAG